MSSADGQDLVRAGNVHEAVRAWARRKVEYYGPNSGWTVDDEPDAIERFDDGDLIVCETEPAL